MNWDYVRAGLFDELEKISAIDTRGLSPETMMAQQAPQPMQTVGYDKARTILDRAQMNKTAAVRKSRDERVAQRAFPTNPGMGKMMHQGDNSATEQAKGIAGYGLAGVGTAGVGHKYYSTRPSVHAAMRNPDVGTAATRFAAEHRVNNLGNKMMLGGAALGVGYGAYRAHKKAQQAKQAQMTKLSNLSSPGMQLKGTQQVAKPQMSPSSAGPSINSQIGGSLIGRKGVPGA